MGGDADKLNPVACLEELTKGVQGAELQVYHGLGHGFIFEAREDVASRILQFLAPAKSND